MSARHAYQKASDSKSLWNYTLSPGFTKEDIQVLRRAIIRHGCGNWKDIKRHLPEKTNGQLNLQCQKLFGQQSLAAFNNVHVDPLVIKKINDRKTGDKVLRKNGCVINTGRNLTQEKKQQLKDENIRKYGVPQEIYSRLKVPVLSVERPIDSQNDQVRALGRLYQVESALLERYRKFQNGELEDEDEKAKAKTKTKTKSKAKTNKKKNTKSAKKRKRKAPTKKANRSKKKALPMKPSRAPVKSSPPSAAPAAEAPEAPAEAPASNESENKLENKSNDLAMNKINQDSKNNNENNSNSNNNFNMNNNNNNGNSTNKKKRTTKKNRKRKTFRGDSEDDLDDDLDDEMYKAPPAKKAKVLQNMSNKKQNNGKKNSKKNGNKKCKDVNVKTTKVDDDDEDVTMN